MTGKEITKILGCYLLLVLIGWISIYATGHSVEESRSIFDLGTRAGKQFLWICISLGVGALILFVIKPYLWDVISSPAYLLILLLLAVTIFFGSEVNGSKSWFALGPIRFQPCELSKITTSLLLAHVLRNKAFGNRSLRNLLLILAVIGIPAVLILAEKETGSTLVYFGYIFVLYREGLSGWWLMLFFLIVLLFILSMRFPLWIAFAVLITVVAGCYIFISIHGAKSYKLKRKLRLLCLSVLILGSATILSTDYVFHNILKPHQKQRVEVLLGLKEDPMGAGYNVNQSLIAIGSGGLKGKGYLEGTQTTYGFVPEQSTDFIFCTIGEEFGFIGCLVLISLFVFLIGHILKMAESSREPFNRIYGYCIASCLFMHMLINIGMTIKLMPVIGIPLPFISYGGTSLLSFSVMLFIFLALIKQEKRYF